MRARVLATVLLLPPCISLAQTPTAGSGPNQPNATAPTTSDSTTSTAGSPDQPQPPAQPTDECGIKAIPTCVLHVAQDEWGIVKAPLGLRAKDEPKLVVFGVATTL